ncbi:MurR/RpiR family transcriptional regulator [Aquibacillus albus]|uniref:DNA-binding MurR/RpiR family transcriptional regulator n=1 Tax=Aquibacillus albus TaxID=1168171 RepID=A0ABS2MVY2_9BACI|nr:MurR/RpiR family transcriptional regulator [Aquibacillus albus]MBM7570012.1 DNA-binding MurR/RpiR family transcriptional regulator [Aquibacillus albus]
MELFDVKNTKMSYNQKKIADFIMRNTTKIPYFTEQDIAIELKISIATVSRFWKVVGFKNFKDFKLHLKETLDISPANKMKDIIKKVDQNDLVWKMIDEDINHLLETRNRLSQRDIRQAVQLLNDAESIYVHAPGPSESLGKLFQFRMERFGLQVKLIAKSGHELFEQLVHIKTTDVILLFGFVNMSAEAKVILDYKKKRNTKTILITDRLVSDMNNQVEHVLYASRGEMWEFHSMVAPTAILESLIVGVGMMREDTVLETLQNLNNLRKTYATHLPK